MTAVATAAGGRTAATEWRLKPGHYWLLAFMVVVVAGVARGHLEWMTQVPANWLPPLRAWTTDFFRWLGKDASLGLFTVRELTRGIAWLLSWPLKWSESLLHSGFRGTVVGPLPWVALVLAAGILGHWIKGWSLALLAAGGVFYFAVFGVWSGSMQTLSLVLVTAPLAAGIGLALGIAAVRNRMAERVLTAMFDVMQSVPHLAYLAPVVVLFGFGQVPGMIATAIFAMPPMARCTILGIRTVPAEVVEAGWMAGCTTRQLLWKVQLPAARPTLMVGVNQVIMQTLAMVVIASLIGVTGLGHELLFSLQQLRLGKAVELGVAIVVMAVVLDRLSQNASRMEPSHERASGSFARRHAHSLTFVVAVLASIGLALVWPVLHKPPQAMTVTTAPMWDAAVKWMTVHLYAVLSGTRDFLTVYVLIPTRNAFQWLPWPMVAGLLALLGHALGGWRLCLTVAGMCLLVVLVGMWGPALVTLYYTFVAVVICTLVGVPLGVWAAHNAGVRRVVMTVCDTLQTFPSFIYLIPVIMLFRVGDLAIIIAILGYAVVPVIRLTCLGLLRVSESVVEAATASGCSRRQLLWKVEMPLALPEIMLGINQTIMMALAMTAITALIGSRDLGQEILKALPDADTGRGIAAGLSIAMIGMIADRLIGAWSRERKQRLGVD